MATSTEPTATRTPIARVVGASLIGTTVEWYDFFLYGVAASVVFGDLFFPKGEQLTGTLLSFATFAVGFFARPIGGVVFGHFGDRLGRKNLLVLSLVMMGLATFAIGLLPTYAQVGALAPDPADRTAAHSGLRARRRVGWRSTDRVRARQS